MHGFLNHIGVNFLHNKISNETTRSDQKLPVINSPDLVRNEIMEYTIKEPKVRNYSEN